MLGAPVNAETQASTSSAAARLAGLLPADRAALKLLAAQARVPLAAAVRAQQGGRGRDTDAGHYLALCIALGVDPLSGQPSLAAGTLAGELDRKLFALGAKVARYGRGHSLRTAARAMRISPAALSRIENGRVRGIACMLAAAAYIGVHPLHYVGVGVGFTCDMTGNTLSAQAKRAA